MSFIAAAVVGGSVIGGVVQANSAKKASRTQAQAATDAAAAEERMAREAMEAQRIAGERAAGVYGGALDAQLAGNQQVLDAQTAANQPYMASGVNALNGLGYEMGMGARPEGYSGFQATPGYEFSMREGQRAIDGSAAATGGLFSGATLKAQQRFGTGLANQEYSNFLNRLSGMADSGQAAANQQGAYLGNFGANNQNARQTATSGQANAYLGIGNSAAQALYTAGQAQAGGYIGAGNARAAGTIGAGNAVSSGINNALSGYMFLSQAGMTPGSVGSSLAPTSSLRPQVRPF